MTEIPIDLKRQAEHLPTDGRESFQFALCQTQIRGTHASELIAVMNWAADNGYRATKLETGDTITKTNLDGTTRILENNDGRFSLLTFTRKA